MFRKDKVLSRGTRPDQPLVYQKRFKALRNPLEAVELLQEVTDQFANADKHSLEHFIVYLRQCADDIQFKYYKARCLYTLIPPEDSIAFWVCYTLGSLPENIRFSNFEGEVLELLKVLSLADQETPRFKKSTWKNLSAPSKDIDLALSLLKEEYPIFFNSITKNPLLIPVLNFRLVSREGSVMTIPRLHCLGFFQPCMTEEGSLIPILHAIARVLHHYLTEDANVMPPGFLNMYQKVFDDYPRNPVEWEEIFAEIFIASLLNETEYMPLVAYMELCHEDQVIIRNYFTWLEMIFASSLQDNMQKIIHQCDELRRA